MRSERTILRQGRWGFTLIEAIICVLVVSIAVPPTIWAVGDASMKRAGPKQVLTARWLATEKLEDIIADRNSATRGYAYVIAGNYSSEASVTGFSGYSRSVAISETGASLSGAGTGYKTVTVTVTWTDYRKTARSLAISTVVTSY